MSHTILHLTRTEHPKGDTRRYTFKFGAYILAAETIDSVLLNSAPVGLAAGYTISGKQVIVAVNTTGCDVTTEYILTCGAASSGLYTPTLAEVIQVTPNFADIAGATPISGTLSRAKYVAYLDQSGTGNPVATITSNALSGPIVWTRLSEGVYRGVLAGAFPVEAKTLIMPQLKIGQVSGEALTDSAWIDTGTIQIRVMDIGGNLTDGFTDMLVVVEVFA